MLPSRFPDADPNLMRALRARAKSHGRAANAANNAALTDPRLARRAVEIAMQKREERWQRTMSEQSRHGTTSILASALMGGGSAPIKKRPAPASLRDQGALGSSFDGPGGHLQSVPLWMGRSAPGGKRW